MHAAPATTADPARLDFTLTDAAGTPHEYICTLHPATDGQRIMFAIIALGAEPIARIGALLAKTPEVIDALKAQLSGAPSGEADTDIGDLLASVDIAGLGADIRSALATADAPGLVRAILTHTIRDGVPLGRHGTADHNFDLAYRGNYGELLVAVFRVVTFNRFFPLPGTF